MTDRETLEYTVDLLTRILSTSHDIPVTMQSEAWSIIRRVRATANNPLDTHA